MCNTTLNFGSKYSEEDDHLSIGGRGLANLIGTDYLFFSTSSARKYILRYIITRILIFNRNKMLNKYIKKIKK